MGQQCKLASNAQIEALSFMTFKLWNQCYTIGRLSLLSRIEAFLAQLCQGSDLSRPVLFVNHLTLWEYFCEYCHYFVTLGRHPGRGLLCQDTCSLQPSTCTHPHSLHTHNICTKHAHITHMDLHALKYKSSHRYSNILTHTQIHIKISLQSIGNKPSVHYCQVIWECYDHRMQ